MFIVNCLTLVRTSLQDYEYAPEAKKKKEEGQDLSKIPGTPGHDYPIYHEFPETNFDCESVPAHPGIYANVETGCQVCWLYVFYSTLFLEIIVKCFERDRVITLYKWLYFL